MTNGRKRWWEESIAGANANVRGGDSERNLPSSAVLKNPLLARNRKVNWKDLPTSPLAHYNIYRKIVSFEQRNYLEVKVSIQHQRLQIEIQGSELMTPPIININIVLLQSNFRFFFHDFIDAIVCYFSN